MSEVKQELKKLLEESSLAQQVGQDGWDPSEDVEKDEELWEYLRNPIHASVRNRVDGLITALKKKMEK